MLLISATFAHAGDLRELTLEKDAVGAIKVIDKKSGTVSALKESLADCGPSDYWTNNTAIFRCADNTMYARASGEFLDVDKLPAGEKVQLKQVPGTQDGGGFSTQD